MRDKKNFYRSVAWLMALVMWVSVPLEVCAAEDIAFVVENSDGDSSENIVADVSSNDIIWGIDANGKLTVTGTGDFERRYGYAPWYDYKEKITSAKVNVTGMTDASAMFWGCRNMTSIELSGFNTENVTSMASMFGECRSLETLDLSSFNAENVINMNGMFSWCNSLTSLNVRGFNTGKVTEMSSMFLGCNSLTVLDISDFRTENVTGMRDMFSGCGNMTSLNLSNFDMGKVVNSENMFSNCVKLARIDTPINLKCSVALPTATLKDTWTQSDGTETARLPMNRENSIVLTKTEAATLPYSGVLGTKGGITWEYDEATKKLTVSGDDELYGSWNNNVSPFKIICDSLEVEEIAFTNCKLSDSAEALFAYLRDVKKLDLSGLDTSAVTNMNAMFSGCSGLTSLDVSKFRTDNVTAMGSMFSNCSSLTSLDVSGFCTDNLTFMAAMFCGCSNLTSLNVGGFKLKNVREMHDLFSGCSSLTSLDLSGFDMSDVTRCEDMFQGCTKLAQINTPINLKLEVLLQSQNNMWGVWQQADGKEVTMLPMNRSDSIVLTKKPGIQWEIDADGKLTVTGSGDFDRIWYNGNLCATWCCVGDTIKSAEVNVTGMTDTSYMFFQCSSLESLDLSTFDMSNVTNCENMFSGCAKLVKIDTPLNVKCSIALPLTTLKEVWTQSDGETIANLPVNRGNSITLTKTETATVPDSGVLGTRDGITWRYDEAMKTLTVSGDDELCASMDGWTRVSPFKIICASLEVEQIVFTNCKLSDSAEGLFASLDVKKIELSGLDTSAVTKMNYMFYDCRNLASLDVSGLKTDNVIDMERMFCGCLNLTSLDVSGFKTDNVENMIGMFLECSGLTSLDVSGLYTDNVTEMQAMFAGCSSLTNLNVRGFRTEKATKMSDMFSGCSSLKSLDVSQFNTGSAVWMHEMFYGCSGLTSLDVSHFNTESAVLMHRMFTDCSGLESLDLSSFDMRNVTACENMISGCTKLVRIDTPMNLDGVVDLPVSQGAESVWLKEDGAEITTLPMQLTQSIRLTQIPTAAIEYTVSFDLRGRGTAIESKQVVKNGKVIKPAAPTAQDYVFAGWYKDESCANVWDFEKEVVNKNITLFAKWVKAHKITYYDGDDLLSLTPAVYGEGLETELATDVKKEGYIFGGWYTDKECKSEAVTKVPAGSKTDLIYYAKWNASVKVSFELQGHGTAITAVTVEKDGKASKPADPTAEGFTFGGWYKEAACTTAWDFDKDTVSADTTLYAKWTPLTKNYTVIFHTNGAAEIAAQTVEEGKTATEPKAPTKNGYNFGGWYTDAACTAKYDFATAVTADVTLYAKWLDASGLKIYFVDENGITLSSYTSVYTGSAIAPNVQVMYNGEVLTSEEYSLTYANNTKVGTADDAKGPSVTVKGKGRFTGTYRMGFTIQPVSLKDLDYVDSMKVVKGQKAVPIISCNGTALQKDKDYTIDNPETFNQCETDGVMTVKGTGNFKDSIAIHVQVVEKSAQKSIAVTVSKAKLTYNGKAQAPEVTVKEKVSKGGASLTVGKDYVVYTSGKAINAGSYSVTVVGIGDYTGSLTKKYTISPLKLQSSDISASYSGTVRHNVNGATLGSLLKVTGKTSAGSITLKDGVDYTISYSNNKKAGTGKYTLNFKGNYKGTKAYKGTFTIAPLSMEKVEVNVVAADKTGYTKPGVYKSSPVVTVNGMLLKSSDYTVQYYTDKECTKEMSKNNPVTIEGDHKYAEVYMKLTSKGSNYTGSVLKGSYKVYRKNAAPNDLSKAKVKLSLNADNTSYSGKELTPTVASVEIGKGKNAASVSADCYEVTYINNVNPGTAKVMICGIEEKGYYGCKVVTFKIKSFSLANLFKK